MPRFQFTLRDVFLATTLIAVGVVGLLHVFQHASSDLEVVCGVPLSLSFVGAGMLAPLRQKYGGAVLGFCAGMAYFLLPAIVAIFNQGNTR